VEINGLTTIAITKLDVLSGFEKIGIVTNYRIDGKSVGFSGMSDPRLTVDVEEMDGWTEYIGDIRSFGKLPKAAQAYVARIEELLGVSADLVSVGPERSQLARP